MYRLYIDINGVMTEITNDVIGLKDIRDIIVREDDIFGNKVLRNKIDIGSLNIYGNTYKYICVLIGNNPCATISSKIYYDNTLIYEGEVRVSDVAINPYKGIATIKNMYDDGYSSRIDAAKNHKIYLSATKSKNSKAISISSVTTVFIQDYTNNTYNQSRKTWDVLDVLKFLVSYATDNDVKVKSDYLTSNKSIITTVGQLVQLSPFGQVSNEYPEVSLSLLLDQLYRIKNIKTSYTEIGNVKYLVVEPSEYFFENVVIAELPININDEIVVNNENKYENIKVGSNTYIELNTIDRVDAYGDSGIKSYRPTEVNNCNNCNNRDSVLDLTTDFIVDTDYIETCISSPIGIEYSDMNKIVFVDVDSSYNALTYPNGANYYYNDNNKNDNILYRHLDNIPTCFTKFFAENGNFKATNDYLIDYTQGNMGLGSHYYNPFSASLQGQIDQITFELYDEVPNNYDNSTCIWQNLSGTTIRKKFRFTTSVRRAGTQGNTVDSSVNVKISIHHYDSTFTTNKGIYINNINIPKKNNAIHSGVIETPCINIAPADRVYCKIEFTYSGRGAFRIVMPANNTIFECYDCDGESVGSIIETNASNAKNYKITNTGSIDCNIFNIIKNNMSKMLRIEGIDSHIIEMAYNYESKQYTYIGLTNDIKCCYDK